MPPINEIINNIVKRTNDFCGLCHKNIEEDKICIDDEVIHSESSVQLSEVLSYILGDQVLINLPVDTLCNPCVVNALKCFSFLKMCNENMKYFSNFVESLNNSLAYNNIEYQCKTLFLSIDTDSMKTEKYFDNRTPLTSPSSAVKRFQSLVSSKTKHCLKFVKLENQNISVFGCDKCQRVFQTHNDMKQHCIRVHAPKNFQCDKCPRSYGSQKLLERHKSRSQCIADCSHCGKTFTNQHTLRMHELGHEFRIVCQACGRIYKNKNTFRNHIDLGICSSKTRRSPSQAQFTCDICKKRYTQKHSLRVHMKFEHGDGKAHVCKWCNKKFSCPSRLKAHTVKHTRERNFVCDLCGGKFVTKETLLYHTRIHTGETPYPCEHCERSFLSASRRSDHVRSHHIEPNFECDVCTRKFRKKADLAKHKTKHDIVEELNENV